MSAGPAAAPIVLFAAVSLVERVMYPWLRPDAES